MSVRAMTWAWDQEGLNPTQKLVLMRLADHSNDEGMCWPGKDLLATKCSCDRRTIDRAIVVLEERGLLRIVKRVRDDGSQASNVYELNMKQADLFAGGGKLPPHPGNVPGGRVADCRGEDGTVPPLEPSLESPSSTSSAREERKTEEPAPWRPPAELVKLAKASCKGLTDEFIEDALGEFRRFAGSEQGWPMACWQDHWLDDVKRKFYHQQSRNPPVPGQRVTKVEEPEEWWASQSAVMLEGDRLGLLWVEYGEIHPFMCAVIARRHAKGLDVPEHVLRRFQAAAGAQAA